MVVVVVCGVCVGGGSQGGGAAKRAPAATPLRPALQPRDAAPARTRASSMAVAFWRCTRRSRVFMPRSSR